MKTHVLFFAFMLFTICSLQAQTEKDTLFFSIDKYYTISPTIIPNFGNKSYSDWIAATKEQMEHTKTNGYIFFIGNGYLIKDLKPKKIISIKDYIENRKFYLEGKYNKIIDKRKLKDSLVDKYTIFFVNGDEYIEPRDLEYNSYYPRRDKNWNFVSNNIKDTLYFKFDNEYVYKQKEFPDEYFLREESSEGGFFLKEIKKTVNLKPEKVLNFKDFIQSSKMYYKHNKMFNTHELAEYLSNYVVFLLIKENKEIQYIEVSPGYAIE
ncbi:hypothetical protein [Flavobacterium piscis]|uniref:Uncharacterized protein n=1 Tax=Flavobacterium piscis TaxID=1114874 RepID=A0ABU1Y3G0_9FLAO|nr:hypothetical protein [Flavobacterium piscis]MDR7208693.1 hypothetical protein [Flavobacterium piscis]